MDRNAGTRRTVADRGKKTTKRPAGTKSAGAPRLRITKRERAIFDRQPLGVVASDLDRIVRYANPEALRIFGLQSYKGLSLDNVFHDTSSQALLDAQLKRRREGYIGTYRARLRDGAGGRDIPVDITGLPLTNREGDVIGALGVFKSVETEEATHDIQRLNGEMQDGRGLILKVAERLCETQLPAEAVIVSRYSQDHAHSNPFMLYRHNRVRDRVEWSKRWIALTPEQQADVQTGQIRLVPDLVAFLKDEKIWRSMEKDPFVQNLIRVGFHAVLSRPVWRKKKVIGVVSLLSRQPGAFDETHKRLIQELPVDASVVHAIDHEVHHQQAERFRLLQDLIRCREVDEVCDVLVRRLTEIFGWSHVSIFRVDRVLQRFRLVAQHSPRDTAASLPPSYEQALDQGVLGRVVAGRKPENVPDVVADPDYVEGPLGTKVRSELCWPIIWGDGRHVHWIINVEDEQENAFSENENAWLGEVARDACGFLESIGTLQFLSECFRHTSEPTVVTDANFDIKKANPAAAWLLGVDDPKEIKGGLGERFADPKAFAQASASKERSFSAHVLRSDDPQMSVPVHVSRENLPENLGGYIFVLKDMRKIRRNIELELLEKAAYEVAVQTTTPLARALAELERLATQVDSERQASLDHVMRLLGRVKGAYMRMAMFNPNARPGPDNFTTVDLGTELDAVRASLPKEERSCVDITGERAQAVVRGDPFQIAFIFETLLSALVRFAPEERPVVAEIHGTNGNVEVRLAGYVPSDTDSGLPQREWRERRANLRIAQPLVEQFMGNHGGEVALAMLADGRCEYRLRFPRGVRE